MGKLSVRVLRSHEFQAQRVHAVEHAPVPLVPDQGITPGGAVDVVEVAGRQGPVTAEVGVPNDVRIRGTRRRIGLSRLSINIR